MPIDTSFTFAHQVQKDQGLVPADLLGLLRGFVGDTPAHQPQRTWKGKGFNMIWRPNFGNRSGSKDFFLQLNMTDETLAFTDITGKGIANRGFLQSDIALGGVSYLQTVNDSFDNSGQHFEPGVWANIPLTTAPGEPATVTRMGSIPHGTTVNLQGNAFTVPRPRFDPSSITPFQIGSPDDGVTNLVPFDEEDLSKPSTSRTDLSRVKALTQDHLKDPNKFLTDGIAGLTITNTTVIVVSSDTSPPGNVPDVGGGTDNIAFLVGKGAPPAGGPNANAAIASAIFWIEQGTDATGCDVLQLQYTQRVLLNFNGLSWPHVTVATFRCA